MKLKRIVALSLCFCLILTVFAGFPSMRAEAMNVEMVVVGGSVSAVRSEPSPEAGQVTAVTPNSTFLLLDTAVGSDGADWYKIYYSTSISGWISSADSYLKQASSSTVDLYTRYLKRVVWVSADSFALMDDPNGSTEIVKVSKYDHMVVVDHRSDARDVTWYEVCYGNLRGWIRRTAVVMTNICSAPAPLDCSDGRAPVIYLSPSRQPKNPYAAGKTNECEQMTRVAVELKAMLESRYHCRVILAEYDPVISKYGRPLEAIQQGTDIYIAIHSNAGGSAGSGYGPQGYYYPGSAQNRLMAENLVNSIAAVTPFDNSSKRVINGMEYINGVGYGEVRDPGGYGMISILLEVEFHDHADSAMWIINNTAVIADAIADGLH